MVAGPAAEQREQQQGGSCSAAAAAAAAAGSSGISKGCCCRMSSSNSSNGSNNSSCSGKWMSQGVALDRSICICIVGGGNIAAAAAAWLSRADKSFCVHVLTRQPQKWRTNIHVRANPTCRWGAMKPYEANINL